MFSTEMYGNAEKENMAMRNDRGAPPVIPTEPRLCGKPAASFIPRLGKSFACVLEPNHEGEHRPGGTCVTHGAYVGQPHVPPQCPKWPECASPTAPIRPQSAEQLETVFSELRESEKQRGILTRCVGILRGRIGMLLAEIGKLSPNAHDRICRKLAKDKSELKELHRGGQTTAAEDFIYPFAEQLIRQAYLNNNRFVIGNAVEVEAQELARQLAGQLEACARAAAPAAPLSQEDRIYELERQVRAADAVMKAIDREVEAGRIGSRSEIADRRLDYSQPYTYFLERRPAKAGE